MERCHEKSSPCFCLAANESRVTVSSIDKSAWEGREDTERSLNCFLVVIIDRNGLGLEETFRCVPKNQQNSGSRHRDATRDNRELLRGRSPEHSKNHSKRLIESNFRDLTQASMGNSFIECEHTSAIKVGRFWSGWRT